MNERSDLLGYVWVYQKGPIVSIFPAALVEAGYRLVAEPGTRLRGNLQPELLGSTVRDMIQRSRLVVPTPSRDQHAAVSRGVLEPMGLRSWSDVASKSRLCMVIEVSDGLLIEPQWNGGGRGDEAGFHPVHQATVTIPLDVSNAELGLAVNAGLARSFDHKPPTAAS